VAPGRRFFDVSNVQNSIRCLTWRRMCERVSTFLIMLGGKLIANISAEGSIQQLASLYHVLCWLLLAREPHRYRCDVVQPLVSFWPTLRICVKQLAIKMAYPGSYQCYLAVLTGGLEVKATDLQAVIWSDTLVKTQVCGRLLGQRFARWVSYACS
jgi:hypothetical protein